MAFNSMLPNALLKSTNRKRNFYRRIFNVIGRNFSDLLSVLFCRKSFSLFPSAEHGFFSQVQAEPDANLLKLMPNEPSRIGSNELDIDDANITLINELNILLIHTLIISKLAFRTPLNSTGRACCSVE